MTDLTNNTINEPQEAAATSLQNAKWYGGGQYAKGA